MPDIDIYNKNKIKVNKIKSGKITPEAWGIEGKSKEEVTITDIINANNQFQPMRDGSFAKTSESQGRQALAAAIKGGGLDPREIKKKLMENPYMFLE